jgi:starvation-inducible DNA-binding protein
MAEPTEMLASGMATRPLAPVDPQYAELQAATRKAFATTYGFLLMSQCYHWNVDGPNFLDYHDLFGRIYKEVDKKLDSFAEHVRSIRAYVPAKFTRLLALSSVVEPEYPMGVWPLSSEMISNIYLANSLVNNDLMDAYNKAEMAREYGLANFLAERMDQHRKHGWMLYSMMKVE